MSNQTTPEQDECVRLLERLTIDLKKKRAGMKHDPITQERVDKVIKAIRKTYSDK